MEFRKFNELMNRHFKAMAKDNRYLFTTDIDNDFLWNLYLDSFPTENNSIFRKKRAFDCNCCRHFLRKFANVVAINNNKLISIWDFEVDDKAYTLVINALSEYVKSRPVNNIFTSKENYFGTEHNVDSSEKIIWYHFHVNIPDRFIYRGHKSIEAIEGEHRDLKNVFQRSLNEISKDSIESVLDLISQNSLYKGEEWREILKKFLVFQENYNKLKTEGEKNNFSWIGSITAGPVISKIRNHSIGVLLTDITNGIDLEEAVKRYERIVAPSNYKRPQAIFTQKMLDAAKKKLEELDMTGSLERRFAEPSDLSVNDVIYANRDIKPIMKGGDVFSTLEIASTKTKERNYDKLEEIPIEKFISEIIPRSNNIEVLFENKNIPNLVSIIGPKNPDSKSLFKWDNGFSWFYNGNMTDSMKERVKAAGGKVDGVLRFSIQWNDGEEYNQNDLDAHCVEPSNNEIYFRRKRNPSTGGHLDVDIINPKKGEPAVENITWPRLNSMGLGNYTFFVNCYSNRNGRDGFKAEIEFNGSVFSYEYKLHMRTDQKVKVATVNLSKSGFKIEHHLKYGESTNNIWGLNTGEFYPVSLMCYSPNYWGSSIGNKHYMFILKGCINDKPTSGIFNEFLKEELLEFKRVFEAMNNKIIIEPSENQLSGLGFSSTQRNYLICRVEGHVKRIIKIIF